MFTSHFQSAGQTHDIKVANESLKMWQIYVDDGDKS